MPDPSEHAGDRPSRRLISLRTALFIRFGLIGVGAVLLFTLTYFLFGLFPLVNRIAAGQFDTTIKTAEAALREPFSQAETIIRIASGWGAFDADQPASFNARFIPVLTTIPQATSIVAGTTDGLGWLLLQLPENRWHNRFTDIGSRGNSQLYYEWQGDRLLRRYYKEVDYDPRQRLWFKMAMSAPAGSRPHWTPPYRFFTTGEPGITVAIRRDLPDMRSFVVGMDLKLIDISSVSKGLSVGDHGYVLVLTDDGKLLGLPREDGSRRDLPGQDAILKGVEDLGLEPVTQALVMWRGNKKAFLTPEIVEVRGERWLFVMHPLPLGEQTFWIAAFAPATDFLPSAYNIGRALAACLALVLILTYVAARQQSRRISRPLEALALASGKIARLDFSAPPPISSRWREIESLVAAQANMLAMLRNFQATVSSQAEELKEQVVALSATRDQLRTALLQEQVILDNAMSGILFVKDRRIVRANRRACEMFGFGSIQEMMGISSEFMYQSHEEFLATGAKAYETLARGESYGEELLLSRRDGSTFWGYLQGRALNVSEPVAGGSVWIVTDLTERKEIERLKEEMLSAVGHEVRTPLTGMMGYAELMMEAELPPEQRREFLGIIFHETERLAELFDNFLDLQSIKNMKTAPGSRPLHLEPILKQAVALFMTASKKHHLHLDCQIGLPAVKGDGEQLHRAFVNLISNAIKYSPDGGRVTVSASREVDSVLIKVEDEGIGISPAAKELIFETFFRVDNRDNRRIGGTGLGLALVKETVSKHAGQIWVESQVGQGSSFFVSLPVYDIGQNQD